MSEPHWSEEQGCTSDLGEIYDKRIEATIDALHAALLRMMKGATQAADAAAAEAHEAACAAIGRAADALLDADAEAAAAAAVAKAELRAVLVEALSVLRAITRHAPPTEGKV